MRDREKKVLYSESSIVTSRSSCATNSAEFDSGQYVLLSRAMQEFHSGEFSYQLASTDSRSGCTISSFPNRREVSLVVHSELYR